MQRQTVAFGLVDRALTLRAQILAVLFALLRQCIRMAPVLSIVALFPRQGVAQTLTWFSDFNPLAVSDNGVVVGVRPTTRQVIVFEENQYTPLDTYRFGFSADISPDGRLIVFRDPAGSGRVGVWWKNNQGVWQPIVCEFPAYTPSRFAVTKVGDDYYIMGGSDGPPYTGCVKYTPGQLQVTPLWYTFISPPYAGLDIAQSGVLVRATNSLLRLELVNGAQIEEVPDGSGGAINDSADILINGIRVRLYGYGTVSLLWTGSSSIQARDLSNRDPSIHIVGSVTSGNEERAVLWKVSLQDGAAPVIHHIDLTTQYGRNNLLRSAYKISPNGRYILGVGRQADGSLSNFLLDIMGSSCQGDVNGDGTVNDDDLLIVLFNFGCSR